MNGELPRRYKPEHVEAMADGMSMMAVEIERNHEPDELLERDYVAEMLRRASVELLGVAHGRRRR